MKSRIFVAVVIILIASACQNFIPASSLQTIPLMAVLENANPLFARHFSLLDAACNNGSAFVKDITIKDGMEIAPSAPFTKKWEIKNTGACNWNKWYSLQYFMGDRMSGETAHLARWTPPGATIVVSVDLIAPETEGAYAGYWILTNSVGTLFGSYVIVQIVVP